MDGAPHERTVVHAWDFGSFTPAVARHTVAQLLSAWGIDGDSIYDAVLMTSEIATNAIKYVRRSLRERAVIHLRVSRMDDLLYFEIGDPDPVEPQMFRPGGCDEGYRGLFIVDAYAKDWGCRLFPDRRGKVVWWTQPARTARDATIPSSKGAAVSHHLDSPLARQDPRLDISDVYVFRGATGTAFIMNVNPLSGPDGFHPEGLYEFNIDTDDDAVEDQTYRVTFGPRGDDGQQSLELQRLDGSAAQDRDAAGTVLARGRTGQEIAGEAGVRMWAGPAADPFYINGAVIGAVKEAVASATPLDPCVSVRTEAANVFAGTNVSAIVLEVPDSAFSVTTIGFWGTTALPSDSGGWRQINRCANPLINTIFNPDDSQRSSDYNTSQPREDRRLYGPLVSELVAKVVAAMKTSGDPEAHGRRTVEAIFPDILRYEIGTPSNFGFAHRNGRGLVECSPEVMFAIVFNTAVPLGLDSSSAAGTPRGEFPYLAPPRTASQG